MMALTTSAKTNRDLDQRTIVAALGESVKIVTFLEKQAIFLQGDPADAVFFIQEGKIGLTVISKFHKEASLGQCSKGEFCGEGGLAGQSLRTASATAMMDCELLKIDNKAMMHALRRERALSDLFVAFLLAQNIRYHEALVDQLFDTSEKRLARVLLLLAHFGNEGTLMTVIPEVGQEALAGMACTTQERVSFFMNKFKNLGFVVSTNNGLEIHKSLLNVVLHNS